MARKFFRKCMPARDRLADTRVGRWLGASVFQPHLWHVNRRSVSRAIGVGLFWAFIPMPLQMIPSALTAVRVRANVGLAIAMVWLSNPITVPPLAFAQWWVGQRLLGRGADGEAGRVLLSTETWTSVSRSLAAIREMGMSIYIGAFVFAVGSGVLGFLIVDALWRRNTRRRWLRRAAVAT